LENADDLVDDATALEKSQTTNPLHSIEISVVGENVNDTVSFHDNGRDHVG